MKGVYAGLCVVMWIRVNPITLLCHVRWLTLRGVTGSSGTERTRRDCTNVIFKEVDWSGSGNSSCVSVHVHVCKCVRCTVCRHAHVCAAPLNPTAISWVDTHGIALRPCQLINANGYQSMYFPTVTCLWSCPACTEILTWNMARCSDPVMFTTQFPLYHNPANWYYIQL